MLEMLDEMGSELYACELAMKFMDLKKDGADASRMFNSAIGRVALPQHVSTDQDPIFRSHRWQTNLRVLEVDEIKAVPSAPISHPFVERAIGTVRREFLDQMLFRTPTTSNGSSVASSVTTTIIVFTLDLVAKHPPTLLASHGPKPQD